MTWLGHASVLAEVDGHTFLTDPIFSLRASALQQIGKFSWFQCCASIKFWRGSGSGSGSADLCFWLMDPDSDPDLDPDPAIFIINLQDANKKLINKVFLLITFWRYIYIIFKDKKSKRSHKTVRIQVFFYYFCLMIEGSGSRRPKNKLIRRIRIRIRNTGLFLNQNLSQLFVSPVSFNWLLNPYKRVVDPIR
jgi:hypothetical protein